jgi:hypothetical protein
LTVKWKEITKEVKKELENFGFQPTLRTIFYRLFSKQLIPNTSNAYKSLSREMVDARMDGRLPIACFADNTRQVVGYFNEDYSTPQELIDERLDGVRNTANDYTDYIPKWHNQPNYVEVWTEKDTMVGTFESILKGYDIRIVPMRGFSSLSFLYKTLQNLAYLQSQDRSVHILYYGDFDPSGDYMFTDLQNRMEEMGFDIEENGGSFERIAVTPEQVKKYRLPYDPDKITAAKMSKDSRTNGFVEKYGKLYAVEIDALPALIPDIFKQQLVIDNVEKYYDKKIYEELLDEYSSEDVEKLVKDAIKVEASNYEDEDEDEEDEDDNQENADLSTK